ncbi:hypothetical protein [Acidithrix ferrooxidans]|uniref:hypothetical protein n=1 Tax=Acidithrix ferrooxidans TaxID=1280514 RepID=UPI001364A26B|nr:hypothetical protein [Acidithrix ferrooxidans]
MIDFLMVGYKVQDPPGAIGTETTRIVARDWDTDTIRIGTVGRNLQIDFAESICAIAVV